MFVKHGTKFELAVNDRLEIRMIFQRFLPAAGGYGRLRWKACNWLAKDDNLALSMVINFKYGYPKTAKKIQSSL